MSSGSDSRHDQPQRLRDEQRRVAPAAHKRAGDPATGAPVRIPLRSPQAPSPSRAVRPERARSAGLKRASSAGQSGVAARRPAASSSVSATRTSRGARQDAGYSARTTPFAGGRAPAAPAADAASTHTAPMVRTAPTVPAARPSPRRAGRFDARGIDLAALWAQPRVRIGAIVAAVLLVVVVVVALFPRGSSTVDGTAAAPSPAVPVPMASNISTLDQSPMIEPSAAVELYIPSLNLRAEFEEGSCKVKDNALDPASMDKACTYTADDKPYSLPGTTAGDITVVAGHTGAGVPAVFNKLYDGRKDEHKVKVGDTMFVRTAASGDNWLVYTATDLHDPSKEGLSDDTSVWGEGPMPGRLLTISCIQPANLLAEAVRNAVVGWQLEGVTKTGEAAEEVPATEVPGEPTSAAQASDASAAPVASDAGAAQGSAEGSASGEPVAPAA